MSLLAARQKKVLYDLARGCLDFYVECRRTGEVDAWQHVEAGGQVFDCHVERFGPGWDVTAHTTSVDQDGFRTADLGGVVCIWSATELRRAAW